MFTICLVIAATLSALLVTVYLLLPTTYQKASQSQNITQANPDPSTKQGSEVSVLIVVIGDIGHSPRMQCHALSVAKHGGCVTIIGHLSSTPNPELLDHPLVSIIPLPSTPSFLQSKNKLLFLAVAPLKVVYQTWYLWLALAYLAKPAKWMIVQNPPSIPTLAMARLICHLRNTRLIIDWHNFGYSILAMKLGNSHPMVKLMEYHERSFSQGATAHFCVSRAMSKVLRDKLKIQSGLFVLHDRPADIFQPVVNDQHRFEILSSISETSQHAQLIMKGDCKLLVSSTSWTPDEDFSILVDALCRYSALAESSRPDLPHLLVIITGKGPQKQYYLSQIAQLTAEGKLAKITFKTAWLAFDRYAQLLAAASLGVCLHTSSSGVDLPMKVVDMFGAGLPVVGWDRYEAWRELVTENVNGMGFGSAGELSNHLVNLLGPNRQHLDALRQGALNESRRRWDEVWDAVGGKLLELV